MYEIDLLLANPARNQANQDEVVAKNTPEMMERLIMAAIIKIAIDTVGEFSRLLSIYIPLMNIMKSIVGPSPKRNRTFNIAGSNSGIFPLTSAPEMIVAGSRNSNIFDTERTCA